MAETHRRARPHRHRGTAVALTLLVCLAGAALLGCDDDPPATTATTASPSSSAATSSSASALPTADATDAAAGGASGAGPDGGARTDGPPEPSGKAPTPTSTTTQKPPALPATTQPTSQPTSSPATPSATASAAPSGTAALPGVDPKTLPPPEPGSADEMAHRVDEIYQPMQRFKARFEQTYRAKVAGVTKKSTGLLFVEKPAKLSMRYDPPNNNRVVSNGSIVKVYEADNKQMFQQPVAKTEYPGALAFIMGRGLRASFSFKFHEKAKFPGGKVLMGSPRVRNPAYEKAFFYIDRKLLDQRDPRAMRRVLVLDVQKNRNRFDFTEITKPDKIAADEFTFTPPAGTTLVK